MDMLARWRQAGALRRGSRHAADVAYLAAHEALWRNSTDEHDAGICDETPEYGRLNTAAWAASRAVPWWRQLVLNSRLVAKLRRDGFAWCPCGGSLTRLAGAGTCPYRRSE